MVEIKVFGYTLRAVNRKVRWVGRLVGVFLAMFAYELLSGPYQTDYLGALDPYAGAALAYVIGSWLVTFMVVWFFSSVLRTVWRLLGRG